MVDSHVTGTLEEGIPVLTVSYEPALMFQKGARQTLSEELAGVYNGLREKCDKPACVVIIQASTAGSPSIRALLELYKTVSRSGGQILVVDYPQDFRDSLSTLGFRSLPGWSLSATKEEALREIRTQSG